MRRRLLQIRRVLDSHPPGDRVSQAARTLLHPHSKLSELGSAGRDLYKIRDQLE